MSQGLTRSYGGLLATRFLMGIVETGLPAGASLLIASYYRRQELSLRFALFFAFGLSGSCFSGVSPAPHPTISSAVSIHLLTQGHCSCLPMR